MVSLRSARRQPARAGACVSTGALSAAPWCGPDGDQREHIWLVDQRSVESDQQVAGALVQSHVEYALGGRDACQARPSVTA
jgi:hypothetical protein